MTRKKRCPKGHIYRKPYTRKMRGKTVQVKGACIPDRGREGKGAPRVWTIKRPKLLSQFGYSSKKPAKERQVAIIRGIAYEKRTGGKKFPTWRAAGYSVARHIQGIANYFARTNPTVQRKMLRDAAFARQVSVKMDTLRTIISERGLQSAIKKFAKK